MFVKKEEEKKEPRGPLHKRQKAGGWTEGREAEKKRETAVGSRKGRMD